MYFDNSPQYSSAFNSGQFPFNDASSSVHPEMYSYQRSAHGMPLQQGYSSARTYISDSPSSDHNMSLPPAPMFNAAHVPRTFGFMPGSPGSRTDSSDDCETTASTQWSNSHSTYARDITHYRHSSRSHTTTPDFPPLNVQIPQFSQPMSQMIDSAVTPYTPHDQFVHLNGYVFPHSLSPAHTPSPPPSYNNTLAIPSTIKSPTLPTGGRPRETNGTKKCSHCQATTTPLWRRDPSTFKPLCNACGLYLQQRNRLRPQVLIDADADDGNTTDESDANYVGPECSHCRTHHTSVWRRSKTGAQLCNACGVYLRLRGKPRPLHLKKNKIKPRSKHPKD